VGRELRYLGCVGQRSPAPERTKSAERRYAVEEGVLLTDRDGHQRPELVTLSAKGCFPGEWAHIDSAGHAKEPQVVERRDEIEVGVAKRSLHALDDLN
jgi:hypothetical protein